MQLPLLPDWSEISFIAAVYQATGGPVTITRLGRAVFHVVTSYLEDDAGRSPPYLEWTGLSFVFQTERDIRSPQAPRYTRGDRVCLVGSPVGKARANDGSLTWPTKHALDLPKLHVSFTAGGCDKAALTILIPGVYREGFGTRQAERRVLV
jgi:hypothetical protein